MHGLIQGGLAALGCWLALATGAPGASALDVGINAGYPGLDDHAVQSAALLSLHARQWREELTWNPAGSGLRPGPHDGRPFQAPSVAAATRYAMEHGARLLLTLDLPDGLAPSKVNPARYAAWVGSIANYFAPGGRFQAGLPCAERAAYSDYVPELELLNEPYTSTISTPADYSRIVAAASARIRAASPSFRIVISGDLFEYGSHQDWVDGLYAGGLTNAMFDLVTVHTYGWSSGDRPSSPPGDYTLQRLTVVIERFRTHGFGGRFIVGEHGSPSAGYTVTPRAQAAWQVLPRYAGLTGQLRFWRESMTVFTHQPLYRDSVETVYIYGALDYGADGARGGPLWRVALGDPLLADDPGHGLFERYYGLFGWEGRPFGSTLRIKPAGAYLAPLIARSTLPPVPRIAAPLASGTACRATGVAVTAVAAVSRSLGWAPLNQLLP